MSEKKTRVLTGTVTSDKRDQTVTVELSWAVQHPVLKKVMRRKTKLHVHDPENKAVLGDTVRIQECAPVSKTKSWKLVAVL